MSQLPAPPQAAGLASPGVLDALVHDRTRNCVVLAMFERRPWDLGEEQLWQLQEKLNAYASFLLDGEMTEMYPHLADLPVCIQLRTAHPPSQEALSLWDRARQQLSLQEIALEIWDIGEEDALDTPPPSHCGTGCGCNSSPPR